MSAQKDGLSRGEYLVVGGVLGFFMGVMVAITYPGKSIVSAIMITVVFSCVIGGLFAAFKPRGVDGIIDWVLNFWR
jgi:hypothetical protein